MLSKLVRSICGAGLVVAACAVHAEPVATFEYTNIYNYDEWTEWEPYVFTETVESTQSVASVVVSGTLHRLYGSWTSDDVLSDVIVAVGPTNGPQLFIRPFTANVQDLVLTLDYYLATFDIPGPGLVANEWRVAFAEWVNSTADGADSYWQNVTVQLQSDGLGACCTRNGCVVTTQSDCLTHGGEYRGNNTNCGTPQYLISDSALLYQPISTHGTPLRPRFSWGNDLASYEMGFDFNFLGRVYSVVNISTNGNVFFGDRWGGYDWDNLAIPSSEDLNDRIAVLWDDLDLRSDNNVYTYLDASDGVGNRRFIVSWEDMRQKGMQDSNSFQIILHENGDFDFVYGDITPEAMPGDYSVGYQNVRGVVGASIPASTLGSGNTARHFTFVPGPSPCPPSCPACPADFDQDGGITGGDIAAFFGDYERGDVCADVDQDGGITASDVATFFLVFEAGDC
jgi:hypothetical protein